MTYWKERYPYQAGEFEVADRYSAGAVSLPLSPDITDAEVDRVVAVMRDMLV